MMAFLLILTIGSLYEWGEGYAFHDSLQMLFPDLE
jgi:hypothetical protein